VRSHRIFLAVALLAGAAAIGRAAADDSGATVKAGVARTDITWHAPGAQGQYSNDGNAVVDDKFDPYLHNVHTDPSDGTHSRAYARAIVVEGTDGTRVAYIGHDLYLQQDILTRRVGQLVAAAGVGITPDHLMIGASHNHSATYLSSTAWGVWAFTDVHDFRFFDFVSHRMAQAVIDAANDLKPARIGAAVTHFHDVQRNILGPAVADDGTPAGFPYDYFDDELAVVRIDDISDESPRPLGMLANLGMHPESISGDALPSADFVGMVERMVTRETGAAFAWSQGSVGDVEPDQDARAHRPEEQREYWHRDFAQLERMSRLVSDAVVRAWKAVETGDTDVPPKYVPFSSDVAVQMLDARFPGPVSHPLPTVSNCRTEAAARGNIGIPVVGLPDCERVDGPDLGPAWDFTERLDVPLPENYGVTGYQGAQESLNVHVQVLRLGDILLASCPCEPVSDMARNFKSRANQAAGDIHDGFDWPCRPAGDDFECNYARSTWRPADWRPVSRALYERMQAQIHNDARGWDREDARAAVEAEAEPENTALIKGNFTKEEIQSLGVEGYRLPIMVGQANDYVGYIVTYREHQRGDHYRKALTAFGPHTADYINTRLVRMAASLKGAPAPGLELLQPKVVADDVLNDAKARALGESAAAAVKAYEATLPDEGRVEPSFLGLRETSTPRFDGNQVRWFGGSTYSDNPVVTVEREVQVPGCEGEDGRPCTEWKTFATQDGGEVVTNVFYTKTSEHPTVAAAWATGEMTTVWQANFEAFETTPAGRYRFVIEGRHRSGREAKPYHLISDAFAVRVWDGITLSGGTWDAGGGTASFAVDPIRYPHTWEGQLTAYISPAETQTQTGTWCFRCTFRPWASEGHAARAVITVQQSTGPVTAYEATFDGSRWTATGLVVDPERDTVLVAPRGVTDEYGNVNGSALVLYEPPLDDGR
jgi:hypothetical protein